MTEARFHEKLEQNRVKCLLCPVGCVIANGESGFCRVRENQAGTLHAKYYGAVTAMALDPIEKKPLRHFYPGRQIFSVGGYSCNMRCPFCQNYHISMEKPRIEIYTPEEIAEAAGKYIGIGNIGLAFTYNEPFVNYEFMYDCFKRTKARGLKNVIITNGYVMPEPLKEILPLTNAMNIDLKGFTEAYYTGLRGGLENVKRVIKEAQKQCHIEITTLIVPGKNDGDEEMKQMCAWIQSLSSEVPLHISRFFPRYEVESGSPTSIDTLYRLAAIAGQYLKTVYIGNV